MATDVQKSELDWQSGEDAVRRRKYAPGRSADPWGRRPSTSSLLGRSSSIYDLANMNGNVGYTLCSFLTLALATYGYFSDQWLVFDVERRLGRDAANYWYGGGKVHAGITSICYRIKDTVGCIPEKDLPKGLVLVQKIAMASLILHIAATIVVTTWYPRGRNYGRLKVLFSIMPLASAMTGLVVCFKFYQLIYDYVSFDNSTQKYRFKTDFFVSKDGLHLWLGFYAMGSAALLSLVHYVGHIDLSDGLMPTSKSSRQKDSKNPILLREDIGLGDTMISQPEKIIPVTNDEVPAMKLQQTPPPPPHHEVAPTAPVEPPVEDDIAAMRRRHSEVVSAIRRHTLEAKPDMATRPNNFIMASSSREPAKLIKAEDRRTMEREAERKHTPDVFQQTRVSVSNHDAKSAGQADMPPAVIGRTRRIVQSLNAHSETSPSFSVFNKTPTRSMTSANDFTSSSSITSANNELQPLNIKEGIEMDL